MHVATSACSAARARTGLLVALTEDAVFYHAGVVQRLATRRLIAPPQAFGAAWT